MRKMKVWGGTHPDEIPAMLLADSLRESRIRNIDSDIANPEARLLGRRFVDTNLVGAFPGDSKSSKYEERRAVEVLVDSQGYDVVIDLHNINGYGENTACIDTRGVSREVLGFLGDLGIRNLILTHYDGIQKYTPNCFVLETLATSLGSDQQRLREALDQLANSPNPPRQRANEFIWFEHLESPHIDQASPDCLPPDLRKTLRGFDILPPDVAISMGFAGREVCLMSWRYEPNEAGYWGELCAPIAVPDDANWPTY